MKNGPTAHSVHDTVAEHLTADVSVTLKELQRAVIERHVNGWSHERCYTVIERCPCVSVVDIGEMENVPDIGTVTDTAVEQQLRYCAAVAAVETALSTYDDPVVDYDLRLQ